MATFEHISRTVISFYSKDMQGKKYRGVPIKLWSSMLTGMGAVATPVEVSELATALATGLVVDDARNVLYVVGRFRNQLQTLSTANFAEVARTPIGMDPTPDAIVSVVGALRSSVAIWIASVEPESTAARTPLVSRVIMLDLLGRRHRSQRGTLRPLEAPSAATCQVVTAHLWV